MIRWLLLLPLLLLKTGAEREEDEDDDSPDDEDEGEENEDKDPLLDDDGKPIRDPKAMIKSLKEANRRLAKKLEKKDQRIKKLEDQDGSNGDGDRPSSIRSARLESAFMRAVFEYRDSIDLEAAWDLATLRGYLDGVKVADDGTVVEEDMEAALEKLVDRYPYLIRDDDEPASRDNGDALPKTRQPRPSRQSKTAVDRAALEKRYPALRGRGRRGRLG